MNEQTKNGIAGPGERCVLDLSVQNVLSSTYELWTGPRDRENKISVPMEPRTPNGDNSW